MNLNILNPFVDSVVLFVSQLVLYLPKLLFAYVLWLVGKWLIDKGVKLINLTNIKALKKADKLRDVVEKAFIITAKVLLILVILDTFGIGSTIIGALLSGLTWMIAIALGLSFGKALEPAAKEIVDGIRKSVSSK